MDDRDELRRTDGTNEDVDSTIDDGDSHATTGGAAAAGAVTGGVIGLAGGPIGAAVGAVGGAIVGAAAERVMHHDDDEERANMGLDNDSDANPLIESRDRTPGMDTTATTGDQGRMQLREEELETRKTSTETGEVRLGKEVVSEQRTVEVPVTREEVYIERQPIDRRPSDTPISETERASIDMPVREEHVTIEKQPVVYEEVGVGKRQVEETPTSTPPSGAKSCALTRRVTPACAALQRQVAIRSTCPDGAADRSTAAAPGRTLRVTSSATGP